MQLLVPNGHYFVQGTLNILQHAYWHIYGLKTFLNTVHKMMQCSWRGLGRHKRYLIPTIRPLVERIYKCKAHSQPYLLYCTITGRSAYNLTFHCFHCFNQMGPILHCSGRHRCTSFPTKVTIYCRRVFGCHLILGCVEENLGGM